MKSIYAVLLCGIVVGLFANCAKKDGGAATGTNEMAATCYYSQQSCNTTVYATSPGFSQSSNSAYGQQQGYSSYGQQITCSNVPYGQPVYSAVKGVGCVSGIQIQSSGTPVIYSLNSSSPYFLPDTAQTAQSQYYYGYQNTSVTKVYRACDSSDPCPASQFCRSPLGPNVATTIGICYY